MTEQQNQQNEKTIDELFREMEEIASSLEGDEVGLEESFRLYREGMELLKQCGEKIDRVEKQLILLDEDGGDCNG
jgi:exodeoxyribonuclease VII small subunit